MKLKITTSILTALVFLSLSTAFGQALGSGGLKLSCEHLDFIEQRYIVEHINFKTYTPELENRVIEQYVKHLDSSKMYLRQADVNLVRRSLKGIFVKIKNRDCRSIAATYKLYIKRVQERVVFAKKILGDKFKFNKKTQLVLDSKSRKYPKNLSEQNRFHSKYIQFQVANFVTSDMSLKEAKEHVIRSYDRSLKRVKSKKLSELYVIYMDAFARGLDPHSSYFSRDQLEDFKISMSLSLEGIGATLSSKDGFTVIEQLITGGAAFRSGQLKPKDKITAVSQAKGKLFLKPVNVIEMELREVVRYIRGKKGTKVKLSILRKEGKESKRLEVVLIRDKIKLEDEAANINYLDRVINGKTQKIAVLNLPSFYADSSKKDGRSAANDMKTILKEARSKNISGLVLDLSTNGGGSLDDAVKIAGLFFKTGNVVKQSQKDLSKGQIPLADKDQAVDFAGPVVILTSRISASASEIVAGTLKDYKRAIIVGGDHTFGKGSIQSVHYLPQNLGAWKTTVGMFFTAGGASTQHLGVEADIKIPSVYSTDEIGEKNLDYSLPPKKISSFKSKDAYVEKGKIGAWTVVDRSLISTLKAKSKKRVAANKDFKEIIKDMKKAKKRGKVMKVSELFEDEAKKKSDKKKSEDSKTLSKAEKIKKYLKRADVVEAVNVLADILTLSSGAEITIGSKGKKEFLKN